MEKGIDAWYDDWEISGGDSLRRKIELGIKESGFFLAFLSENSLNSEWVQTELDAALVKTIEGRMQLVPVLLNVRLDSVSYILRSRRCINLYDYNRGLNQIIDTCHGHSNKPSLGEAPARVTHSSLDLSPNASTLAVLLSTIAEFGANRFEFFDTSEIQKSLEFSDQQMEDSLDELVEQGMLEFPAGSRSVTPQNRLFWIVDVYTQGWDVQDDAHSVAVAMVNIDEEGSRLLSMIEIAENLNWPARRLNPAASLLDANEKCKSFSTTGSHPFIYTYLQVVPATRRFIR